MKLNELVFPHDTKDRFLRRVTEDYVIKTGIHYSELVKNLLDNSSFVDEFINEVITASELKTTQLYAELIMHERPELRWKSIREMFGDKCFKTVSDVGGVKVGTDTFSVVVPNGGRGDGTTRVAVFEDQTDFNHNLMNFSCISLHGDSVIYYYDCGNTPAKKLSGNYLVYYYDGLVAFVKYR